MANSIELAKQFVPYLDEIYTNASLTADLDGAADLASQGANANELIIPMLSMDGLADYDRNSGYANGDITLKNETVKCNYDRGRMFSVDTMDNLETAGIAFGRALDTFERTKVIPELDAFRLSSYASKTGVTSVSAALTTGDAVVKALRTGTTRMDDKEVPLDTRILYITPELLGLVEDLDTTKSRSVLNRFSKVVAVPSSRFYNKITLGASGYTAASGAVGLNFMIVEKSAPIQFVKHQVPKIVTPEVNQDADAYKLGYRIVSIADVYANKLDGIYVHTQKTSTP